MSLWSRYKKLVESNILGNAVPVVRGIDYWRTRLFANMVLYILPLSMLAYVPGMIMCYLTDQPYIALFDNIALMLVIWVTLGKGLSLEIRKLLFVFGMYLLSFSLLYFMGSYGPGLLYLLGCVIVVALIYPAPLSYYSVFANALICAFFTFAIHFQWTETLMAQQYTTGGWIGVFANQILLSIVFAGSIQLLTNGLQETILREQYLLEQQSLEGADLKKAVRVLKMKNEELEQFAYIASHDLQEPLNTISGLVEVLKIEKKKPEEGDFLKGLNYISFSVERLRMLIRGLLDYSRLGAGLNLQPVHCGEIIRNVETDLEAAIREPGAVIRITEAIDQMPPIIVCPLSFNQLFQNLISNALKFRRSDVAPEILIDVEEQEQAWLFSVSDNGIGIDSSHLEKIFIIFKRAHHNRQFAGTGIGLAFCKKIVELHGGKIWVSSTPMEGSTFRFMISKNLKAPGDEAVCSLPGEDVPQRLSELR